MIFEIGKSYEHASGSQMHVCGKATTFIGGVCLIGENGRNKKKWGKMIKERDSYASKGNALIPLEDSFDMLTPIGIGEDYTQNWVEIPNEIFKLNNFELSEKDKKECLRILKLKKICNI